MIYIGIDPGASGGIAWHYGKEAAAMPMPKTEVDIYRLVARSRGGTQPPFALIEKVHAMPGQGVTSMFSFGANYGGLRMALIACAIPFEEVLPARWQREFGLLKRKGETQVQKKNRHKAKAQQLFPHIKVTHAVADALLIMEFNRRTRQ